MTLIFTDEPVKASLALLSLLTAFTSHSLKLPPFHQPWYKSRPIPTLPSQRCQTANRQHAILRSGVYAASYPGGDVPQERGVCSDVVIRHCAARRSICRNWCTKIWRRICRVPAKMAVKAPGQQHRSPWVPNLETWFTRHDKTRPISKTPVTIKRAILSPGDWITDWQYWGGVRWLRPRRYAAGDT